MGVGANTQFRTVLSSSSRSPLATLLQWQPTLTKSELNRFTLKNAVLVPIPTVEMPTLELAGVALAVVVLDKAGAASNEMAAVEGLLPVAVAETSRPRAATSLKLHKVKDANENSNA